MRNLYVLSALLGTLVFSKHTYHNEIDADTQSWNALKPVKEPIYPKTFKKEKEKEESDSKSEDSQTEKTKFKFAQKQQKLFDSEKEREIALTTTIDEQGSLLPHDPKKGNEHELHPQHDDLNYQYLLYVSLFNKDYKTLYEYEDRRKEFIQTHNRLVQLRKVLTTHSVAHNQMSDWTDEERNAICGGLHAYAVDVKHLRTHYVRFEADYLDHTVDWRERGAVTPVRDDRHCASCWASASIAAMEASHFVASGDLIALSTQQLVDCDRRNFGCQGGFPANALEYAHETSIMSEATYPFVGQKDAKCHYEASLGQLNVKSYVNMVPQDVEQMKIAVNMGPIIANIATDKPLFRFYSGGVISTPACGTNLTCSVAIVGYGHDVEGHYHKGEYWIVKNSWGETWGEKGYARIAIEEGDGICGINLQTSIPFTN